MSPLCCPRERRPTDQFDFPLTYLDVQPTSDPDFPLSDHLKERDFVLGQNARMSANQPLARIRHFERQPRDSLFLSAVLDVILKGLDRFLLGTCHRVCSGRCDIFVLQVSSAAEI